MLVCLNANVAYQGQAADLVRDFLRRGAAADQIKHVPGLGDVLELAPPNDPARPSNGVHPGRLKL